jgi:2-phosphoglycolate phosphatase
MKTPERKPFGGFVFYAQAKRTMTAQLFLFDLDGTIVDSAPDLTAATNHALALKGRSPMSVEELRPFAGHGAAGLLGHAFGIKPDNPAYKELSDAFFDYYGSHIAIGSRPFDGIIPMLEALRAAGIKTGVVTNKYERLARKLLKAVGIRPLFDVILGSDSPNCAKKPAPDSLLEAARLTGVSPEQTVYAGDDLRDIQAAHAAGMKAAAVRWGFLSSEPETWQADTVVSDPSELVAWALHGKADTI